ncbi:anti-sigma factor antagonist [Anaerotignum sp.]|uniref:STAS domain-containing protein n=1 Tax=Anaerotignum sp. TaxID=2039241 RepID=UPI00332DCA8D
MDLKITKRNRTLIIKIDGEIDHHTCEILRGEADSALEKMGGKNLIFRMGGVSFMDSSGIGAVIGRYKNIQRLGGRIAVAEANERVEQIFRLSAVQSLIPSFPNVDLALEYVEGGKE